ncbi:putative metal-dependent phosphoesterase, PHP family [Halobacteroides halobius DSM 5150]|uniref:Putative metal-dependent phosphoesterase, PHP family n=1 Tax=Halobacteroides halobius (strain ATCC 35273 / DSM 5150 / MD-1) TaxID=748449 RepID=L0KBX1_HALHC|nr:PHP domain-containing protein [Halobacteroides halobius]AGB41593.1 putative metal-dependent phosphoesterase, PHP family [Halobacteroides halobius DSM 5150]
MLEKNQLPNSFTQFLPKKTKYIDLHIHTTASDGLIKTDFLIKFLQDTPHLISITDHNAIEGNLELYFTPNINIIPGIEVGCKDGFELLIYFKDASDLQKFYRTNVKPFKNKYKITRTKQSYSYYLKQIQKYDAFVSLPHPAGLAQKNYLKNKSYIKQVINKIDAIETYNHALPQKRNLTAYEIRKKKEKFATFGSDAHIKKEILSFYRYQNNNFSKLSRIKKHLYNCCSAVALFGKHLHYLLN